MAAKKTPGVETQMLIRKPVSTVFEAFIDPAVTKHFWFTKGSDKLAAGKTVTWEWEMYNVSAKAVVKEIIPNKKISIDWGEPATAVDFMFQDMGDGTTYVVIRNYGFTEQGDELISKINDSTGGFTTVLDGLKAYLEHGIHLNLIADKFPPAAGGHK
ncbi:SRPBCC family protein [Chitinophaga sp. 22321]|uniref:SRPBCC family protein n=1 Tax=Chitinophaga hostae TaxID=2831022 RepID=A0ABS5JBZ9_9BACT|nr:SRPBCC family protein [Chitinophaga hostae]MBS0032132.1 SRPBCC family protein [Chitinophaga hostae]